MIKGYYGKVSLGIVCMGLIGLFLACLAQGAEELVKREIVIRVKPNIIALPGNQVEKVPILAARIRSTELRELNSKYNAKKIEKLFKVKEKARVQGPKGIKGLKDAKIEEEPVNLSMLFTKDAKKEILQKGKQVVELQNTYLIEFELEEDIDINKIVSAYRDLEVVTYAEYTVRKE